MTTDPESCDFCAIARGDAEAEVVCDGDHWVAFFPLHPATLGHTLIIPREHVENLWAASLSVGGELMQAAIEVGRAIQDALQPDGLNLISSAGAAAASTSSRAGTTTPSASSGHRRSRCPTSSSASPRPASAPRARAQSRTATTTAETTSVP